MRDYLQRAFAAWFRGSTPGPTPAYPSQVGSRDDITVEGKRYVLLANSSQVLGVYRIKNDGLLRRLKRWPKAVEQAAGYEG
jgi:hypothetical protein